MIKALLLMILLLPANHLRGQGAARSYLHFLSKNGLPGDNIYSIVQDKDGFIWIATETGLSRFDGSAFTNFTVKDGLPGNEVTSLFVDRRNRVWISPFATDLCYYYKGRIYNRANSALIRQFGEHSELRSMAEDAAGTLLIESVGSYILIDKTDKCTIIKKPLQQAGFFRPLRGFNLFSKEIIAPDIIAAGKINTPRYAYNFDNNKATTRYIYSIAASEILVYDSTQNVVHIPIPPNNISQYPINDSIVVANTTDGSYVYDVKTGRLLSHFLRGYWVNHTYMDEEGGTWMGTRGSGIFYFPPGNAISVLRAPANKPLQLRNFYPGQDRLIAGTSNSIFWELDKHGGSLKGQIDRYSLPGFMVHPPAGNIVRPAAPELFQLKELRGTVLDILSAKSIACIEGGFLVPTYRNVFKTSENGGVGKTVWNGRATSAIAFSSAYYVGTLKGLYTFAIRDTGMHDAANSRKIIDGNIGALAYTTHPLMLWVTTSDNGLYCLDSTCKVVRHLNEVNGLSGNICKCIYTDGHRVFVGTNNGLNVVDPARNFSVNSYYTIDGLISNDINCVYAEGNRVWVGSPEGYSVNNIADEPDKSYCRFNLTEVRVSGKTLPPDTVGLVLAPDDNNIKFGFSGISFRSMGLMQYYYRLSGLERGWQYTTRHDVGYSLLPAGDYSMEFYATNRYGMRSQITKFRFTVREYWWQHWWVQGIGIALLLGTAIMLLRIRHARLRKREGEKALLRAQIADLEQMALRAQMNPHFIFNSLNSFYQYVVHQDLTGASKFMGDFSMLLRLMFEITAHREITLDREILFLRTYLNLEQTKLNNSFNFSIDVADDLPHTEDISIPAFIIQPFVENSVRHGIAGLKDRRGKIRIRMELVAGELVVRIEDNGIGVTESAAQKQQRLTIQHSKGMALTGERIYLYNQSNHTNVRYSLSALIPFGTLVVIHFPLDKPL